MSNYLGLPRIIVLHWELEFLGYMNSIFTDQLSSIIAGLVGGQVMECTPLELVRAINEARQGHAGVYGYRQAMDTNPIDLLLAPPRLSAKPHPTNYPSPVLTSGKISGINNRGGLKSICKFANMSLRRLLS